MIRSTFIAVVFLVGCSDAPGPIGDGVNSIDRSDSAIDLCDQPNTGCPCDSDASVFCGYVKRYGSDGYITCEPGYLHCVSTDAGNQWSTCEGPTVYGGH